LAAATCRVTFEPSAVAVTVPRGTPLLEAVRRAGLSIEALCGGEGTCGRCRVRILEGAAEPTPACRRLLPAEDLARGVRLACQVRVTGDLRVALLRSAPPAADGEAHRPLSVLTEGLEAQVPLRPNARKVTVRVPEPSVTDQRGDAERLLGALAEAGIEDLVVPPAVLREVPRRLRRAGFRPAVAVVGREVVGLERPTAAEACYGVAFDVGTTTLAGYLVDLGTGEVVAAASRANPQSAWGEDVVSRIAYAGRERGALGRLQRAVAGALNQVVREACRRAHVRPSAVYEAVAVGNTAMLHLLLGLPVDHLGRAPFVPVTSGAQALSARSAGLRVHPRGRLYTGPMVAGFVGADTVAVVLATGMHAGEGLRLAVDIGTNGEVVLAAAGRLLACSTAAGPALEGARIRDGMAALPGAVDRVDLEAGRLRVRTIGDAPAAGLCGSGLVDAVAVLREAGLVTETGRLAEPGAWEGPADLAGRLRRTDDGPAFCLVEEGEHGAPRAVCLTQRDIRELQLAKGAIAAGVATLLEVAGARPQDLEAVYLAGAFGSAIRPGRAQAVGLLPREVPPEQVVSVGNAAGTGARMLLVNRNLRRVAEMVARDIEHVELASRPDFQARFAEAMGF